MRITYIHQHFKLPSEAGGVRSWEFARRLADDGYAVTMICGGRVRRTYTESGFRVEQLPVRYGNNMGFAQRIASFLLFTVWATFTAMREPADVVYATSTPLTVAIPGILSARVRRARFIFEVRDLWPSVPVRLGVIKSRFVIRAAEWLERLAYKAADDIIALSPGMAEGISDAIPHKAAHIIPNACDFERFGNLEQDREAVRAELGWKPDDRVLVYAGSFGASYDVDWFADLAGRAQSERLRFFALGEGSTWDRCRRIVKDYGLTPDDVFLGAVPKDQVAKYYMAADLIVSTLADNPALEVNSLNKVFDAFAAGRPVVFNHGGWLAELACRNKAGWRLPRDPAEAAARLSDIVAGQDLIAGGARAQELGRAHFDRDDLYANLRGLVDRVE